MYEKAELTFFRGKVSYFLTIHHKAIKENAEYGFRSACFYQSFSKQLLAMDISEKGRG